MSFRYTAICHPLKPSLHSGKRKTLWIIASIWSVCIIPSALWLIYAKVIISTLSFSKFQLLSCKLRKSIIDMCCFVFLKIQYLFYSPLDEDRFGGIEEEKRFREQGYVKIEESATCMVKKCKCLKRISTLNS